MSKIEGCLLLLSQICFTLVLIFPIVILVEKQFIYKTRFGAKQISTKVITQKQLSKVFDRSSMCLYHMTHAKSEVLNVNVT